MAQAKRCAESQSLGAARVPRAAASPLRSVMNSDRLISRSNK